MDVKKLEQAKQWVEKELASSAEFWLKYGMDKENSRPVRLDLRLSVPRVWQEG